MSVDTTHGLKQQYSVIVAEEDHGNPGRATLRNGQISRCRPCCASRMTETSQQVSVWYHNDHGHYGNLVNLGDELLSTDAGLHPISTRQTKRIVLAQY